MPKWSAAALVVLSAAIAGRVGQLGSWAPVLAAAGLAFATLVLLRWRDRRTPAPLEPARFAGPLAAAWLVVGLLPMHVFSHRPITGRGPSLDAEALLQLLAFAAAGALAVVVIRMVEPSLERMRPPIVLFLLPVWTMASMVWSATGPYAMGRGIQLSMVALLAWATTALGRHDPEAVGAVAETTLRWLPRITVGLVILGLVFGPRYVSASEANLERFTWMGAHPLASGIVLSVALVIVLVLPASTLRVPPFGRVAMGATFAAALVPNHSRQAWLGVAVAALVGLLLAGHLARLVRWLGAPVIGAAFAAGVIFQGRELWDYLLRNEDTEDLSTGNGRLELWGIGFDALTSPGDWLIGLGHGITRTLFMPEAPWARSAHNSVLAALVSLGLVGVAALAVTLGTTIRSVWRARLWRRSPTGYALTLLLVLALLNGLVADNLVIPNLGSALVYLIAVVAIVRPWEPSDADLAGGDRAGRDRRQPARKTPHGRSTGGIRRPGRNLPSVHEFPRWRPAARGGR